MTAQCFVSIYLRTDTLDDCVADMVLFMVGIIRHKVEWPFMTCICAKFDGNLSVTGGRHMQMDRRYNGAISLFILINSVKNANDISVKESGKWHHALQLGNGRNVRQGICGN
jgi:hypothetical protein